METKKTHRELISSYRLVQIAIVCGLLLLAFWIIASCNRTEDKGFDYTNAFVTVWEVTPGVTLQLVLPEYYSDKEANRQDCRYDFRIDWGDNTPEEAINQYQILTHTYMQAGSYEIKIAGLCESIRLGPPDHIRYNPYLREVSQWGDIGIKTWEGTFARCISLKTLPPDMPDAANLSHTFAYCFNLQDIPATLFRNCTSVTDFSYAFYECSALETIPVGLFAACTNVHSYVGTFAGCHALAIHPDDLLASDIVVQSSTAVPEEVVD